MFAETVAALEATRNGASGSERGRMPGPANPTMPILRGLLVGHS